MYFKHEINGLKDRGDKNRVDENVSEHGTSVIFPPSTNKSDDSSIPPESPFTLKIHLLKS